MKKMILTLSLSILIITYVKASDIIMSASATYTVSSGNFYDAGGPSADYLNNQDVIITLLPATAGSKVSVTFDSFSTAVLYYDGTTFTSNNNDILYVFNGNSIEESQIGAMRGVGYGTVTSTASDGSLTFRFVSHAYNNTSGIKAGWSATISTSSTPPNDITMIGGTFTINGGRFYDAGGPEGDYMNNQNTTLTFFPSTPGAKVSVTFDSFTTAVGYYDASTFTSNNNDILYVYDGNSTEASQIGAMQGTGYGTVTSTAADGSLTFKFVSHAYSNTSGIKAGWSATISCISTPPNDITMIGGTFTTCGGKFYDAGGPDGDYMNNQNTTLTIYPATTGAKVSVTFDYFNTAVLYYDATTFSSNNNDILYVYNGNSITAPQIGVLQGQGGYGTIASTADDGSLTFKFISHALTNNTGIKKGWSATISCGSSSPNGITMIAGTAFTSCNGKFYDSGGPDGDYMNNQNSTLTIYPATPGAKVSVTFDYFNTAVLYYDNSTFKSNNNDVLYVFNGNSIEAPQIGALQGQNGYGTITSTADDGSLTFKFISHALANDTGLKKGWSATISCSSAPPSVITMIAGTAFTTGSAKFYDSGGPDGDYMNNQNSTLTIYPATPGAKLSVTFDYFNTAVLYYDATTFTNNNNDILYVYNGNSTVAPQIGALKGQVNYGTITSTADDGSLTFKFVSHALDNTTGIKKGWSATISCLQDGSVATEIYGNWNGANVENTAIYLDSGNGFQLIGTTSSTKLSVKVSNLKIGDKLRALKKVFTQKAVKSSHESVDNNMFEVWIDSDLRNKDGSFSSVEVKANQPAISLNMKHYKFKYNLLVSVSWDITNEYYNELESGFKSASKYLYNVSDGQVCFNEIAIIDNKQKWNDADIQIIPIEHPNSTVDGIDKKGAFFLSILLSNARISLGKEWCSGLPNSPTFYRTIIHEFGHYGFGLFDEYLNGLGNQDSWTKYKLNHPLACPSNYGFMEYQYSTTEASSHNDYLSSYPVNYNKEEVSEQYNERKMPCWDYLQQKLGKYYLQAVIIPPPPGYYPDGYIYDRLGPDDYTVADSTKIIDLRASAKSSTIENIDANVILMANEKPFCNARVYAKIGTDISYLGLTNIYGEVDLPGAKPETQVIVYYNDNNKPKRHLTTFSEIKAENIINLSNNQLNKGAVQLASDVPGINITGNITFNSAFKIDLELFSDKPLDKAPSLVISYGISNETILLNNLKDMEQFGGSITLNPIDTEFDGTGIIDITYTYNLTEYNAVSNFKIFAASPTELCEVYNRSFNMNIDKENFSDTDLGISFSTFGKPFQLTNQLLYPVTDIFSIGIGNTENFINDVGFNVSYSLEQEAGIDLSSLGIYKWNNISKDWHLISSSTTNPAERSLSCYVKSTGIYGVFADKLKDDNISPSKINDLVSNTGKSQVMIDLSWTSPDDGGTIGKATYYIIKYNEVPITNDNWNVSFDINNEPVPSSYGALENVSLKMPLQNELYYFAIKSVDEAGNVSEISNITSAVSGVQNYTFSLNSPAFNSIVNDLSPTLEWENYIEEEVQDYTLMIADNDLFDNAIIINNIKTNSYKLQYLLDHGKSYFWKVRANAKSGNIVNCNQSYLRFLVANITSIDKNEIPVIRSAYCYPNPFNPNYQYVTIRITLSSSEAYSVRIFDLSGKPINSFLRKESNSNVEQVIYWNGNDSANHKVQKGIYIYEIVTGSGLKIAGKILVSE